jgi:SNF2 family DNA or RNA helicase
LFKPGGFVKVSFSGKNFKIECLDLDILLSMQDIMDGEKVRSKPMIIIPLKSSIHLEKFKDYGIEYDIGVKETINAIISNNQKRIINIFKIKSQYGGEIKFDYECKGRYQPLNHQKVMFNAIYYSDCSAILAEPGTCKTGPYLWAIDKRIKTGKIKKALVITLSGLKENVEAEVKIQTPDLRLVILNSLAQNKKIINKQFKSDKKNIDYDIYIANYESMSSLVEILPEDFFDMIICDEAHRIGSPRSNQTKSIVSTFENTKYKHIITGTLHANNLMSFYMPFRFLGADTVPYANYYSFRQKYMYPVDPDQHIWVPSAGAKETVRKMTGDLSIMFTKEECLDLPPRIYEKYSCEMEGDQKKLYEEMKKDLIGIIDDMCSKCTKKYNCDNSCSEELVAKSALVLYGKLHQIASGFYINTRVKIDDQGHKENDSNIIILNDNPKMRLLIETLNNIPEDRQVIIWTNYVCAVKLISEAIEKAFGNKSYITCFGDQNAYEQVKLFESSKCPYCIANPTKFGVGQNIQFSNYQVFFSNSYSWILRDQAEGRQHRQGQKENVTIIDLLVKDTVDELRLEALINKQDLALNLSQLSRILKKQ